jgi:hypothetical protein
MNVFQTSQPFKWLELCTGVFAPDKASAGSSLSQAWVKVLGLLSEGAGFHRAELALRKVTQQFHAMLLQALREALMTLDARLAHPPCPDCHRPMWRNRQESVTIQLLEGEIKFLRWYCECRPCGLHLHPLDVWLALPDKGECAPQFGQDLCLLAIHLPAQTAVDVLTALTGRPFSRSALQQQVERDGGALVDLEREEAESLWPWDEKQRIRPIQPLGGPPLRATPRPGRGCIVELDGVFANLGRDPAILKELEQYEAAKKAAIEAGTSPPKEVPSRFREVRQARIYRLEDRVTKRTRSGGQRTTLTRSETVSVVNDPEYFQKRVQALIQSWQFDRYQFTAVLGDGGDFIWEIVRIIINPTYEILDVQHARSHIHTCGRALFGEGTADARAWAKLWCHSVYEHGPAALLAELIQLQEPNQKLPEATQRVVKNLFDYVTKHQHRMDYARFRSLGLPIGSGVIEGANRQVVGDRCKRSGMGWSRDGLLRMLSLRAAYLSGNWDQAFAAIRRQRGIRTPVRSRLLEPQPPTVQAPATPPGPSREADVLTDHQVASRMGIPDRKIPSLLLGGFLRRNPSGQLEEAR